MTDATPGTPATPAADATPSSAPAPASQKPPARPAAPAPAPANAWSLANALDPGAHAIAAAGSPFTADRLRIEPKGTVLPPGAAADLVDLLMGGVITQLEIRDNRAELAPEDAALLELVIAASPPLPAHEGGQPSRPVDLIIRLQDLFGLAAGRYRAGDWHSPNLAVEYDVLKFRLPLPFCPGARILLRNSGRTPCRVAGRASGVGCKLPEGTAYLRSQTAQLPPGAGPGEAVLFESHGRGHFAGMVCSEALPPELLANMRVCFYRDGDERLQQIEERPAAEYFAREAAPPRAPSATGTVPAVPPHTVRMHHADPLPFAEYIKCTLTIDVPLPTALSFTSFAYVETRPIA